MKLNNTYKQLKTFFRYYCLQPRCYIKIFWFQGRFHWTMNGVGLEFNHLFGFGVLDAGAMTVLAANWRSVPPRYHCEAGAVNTHT